MKKFNLFKMLAVLIVLITSINAGWAITDKEYQGDNAGWWKDGGLTLDWTKNATTDQTVLNYNAISSGGDLGEITSALTLTQTTVHFWRKANSGNICSSTVYWELYKGDTKIEKNNFSPSTWRGWDGKNNSMTSTSTIDFLVKTTGTGRYTIRVYAKLEGNDSGGSGCDGHRFWYNKNESNGYYAITFTIPPTVTFSVSPAGAGAAITTDPSISSGDVVSSESSVTFTHAEANDGYEWYRWEDGEGNNLGNGSTYTASSITSDVTVVAKYTENDYEVSVVSSSADAGSVASSNVTGHVSTSADLPDATPNKGYYFVNWEVTSGTAVITNSTSATDATINGMTDNVTVRANFAPIWAVVGGDTGSGSDGDNDKMGDWAVENYLTYKETNGSSEDIYEGTIYLAADSTYFFKIKKCDNSKWYGKGSTMLYRLGFIGQSGYSYNGLDEENGTQYQVVRIMTAEEGNYTFTFNSSTKQLAVTYPTVTHPTSHYVYFKYTQSWDANYITAHVWTSGEDTQTGFNNLHAVNTCTFAGNTYYYAALGNESYCLFASLDNTGNKTEDLATAASNKGKYYDVTSGDSEATRWRTFDVSVTLNNQSATTAGQASVTATYNAEMPSITENKPSKTGYSFQGYFKEVAGGSTQYYTDAGASAHVWDQTGANPSIYAKWTQRVTLHDNKNGLCNGYVDVVYNANAVVAAPTVPTLASCHVVGYYADEDCEHLVMEADGTLVEYTDYVNAEGKWIHSGPTTLYAKWESTNFVIYRSGDKDEDDRAIDDQVETYAGGTIDKTIEYRMKVRELNKWYTLCLPFEVNAVKVWGGTEYLPIYPCHRPSKEETLRQGYYVIRTPDGDSKSGSSVQIKLNKFGDWVDPDDYVNYVPSANTPYIIQWNMDYFYGKYISFFGAAGQTIPAAMSGVEAPSDENIKICGNNSMTYGSVAGVYLLDNDYGAGAWLRAENVEEERTILPFECYLLASETTTANNMVIKRRTGEDSATGWEEILNYERKDVITVYTITGYKVAQYENCSFEEAGRRMNAELSEGIYIMNAGNESVKLIIR